MQSRLKLAFAAVVSLFATLAAAPSSAQSNKSPGPAYPQGYYQYPPSYYNTRQGPNGTYDSLADFVSDIRGRPCGIICTQEAQDRWARYYHRLHPARVPAQYPRY
jgi:hypothetical protein